MEDSENEVDSGGPLISCLSCCEPSIYGDEWRTLERREGQAVTLKFNEFVSSVHNGVHFSTLLWNAEPRWKHAKINVLLLDKIIPKKNKVVKQF